MFYFIDRKIIFLLQIDLLKKLNSPYYIHTSRMKLVSEKCNGDCNNYWNRSMVISLSAKKNELVDGSIVKRDVNYKTWSICNSFMISWLFMVLEKDIARNMLYF